MSDLKKFGKKLFASVVTGMTAFSMSFGAFLPAVVHAATTCPEVEAGDLIKVPGNSAVYYVNADMERMYFPNADVYMTWFEDFSGVKEIPSACIDNYPSGGGVNFHAGTYLVKTEVSPNVYVVGANNIKHKLPNEQVAAALYGADWAKKVRILPDVFDANYKVGAALTAAVPTEGSLGQAAGDSNVYVVMDGEWVKVVGATPKPLVAHVHVLTEAVFNTVEMADASKTATAASLLADPSQKGGTTTPPVEPPVEPPVTSGTLTFGLAGSTPSASIIPGGAQNVEYFKFNVTGDGEKLDSLVVKLGGIGDRTDFSKVYLYNGETRIGSGHSINTDDEVNFNVNLTIDGTETFTVRADMNLISGNATAGDSNFFQILNAAAVDTTAAVEGTFPIKGNSIEIGAQDIVTLDISAGGTNTTEKIGQDDVQVGEFDLAASSSDDVWFASVRLQNKGTAPVSVLSNLILRHNGVEVATGEISGDYITFTLDEMLKIEAGDTETFKVYGDLGIGDDADTLQLILDELTDLVAYADDYPDSSTRITNTSLDNTGTGGSTAATTITLDGGDINVDFTGNNMDVRVDQNNVSFGVFSIVSLAEDLDVDSMEFEAIKNAGNPCLEDLRLRDVNGLGSYTLDDTDTCASANAQSTYTVENLILQKGVAYEFEVLADIASTATSGSQYHFTWAAAQVSGDGASSDNAISADMFSSASLTGPTMDVDASSLTVRSTALTDDTVVNGTKNVLMFRGTLTAGDTSDVTISSMTFEDENGTAWSNRIDGLKLFIESDPGEGINIETDTPVKVDNTVSSDTAVFNGFEYTVGKTSAGAVMFEIYADITDGSTTGDVNVKLTAVSATDEDSETVAAQGTTSTAISSQALTSSRVITITGTGSVTLAVDTDFTGLRKDKYVLAGTDKVLAGRIQLLATNEDVKIEDLSLDVSTTINTNGLTSAQLQDNLQNTFDTISVYSCSDLTSDCLLGTEDFTFSTFSSTTGGNIVMNNINFVTKDAVKTYIYLAVKVSADGTGSNGTAVPSTTISFDLNDAGTTAEGYDSGDDLAASSVTATENSMTNDLVATSIVLSDVHSTFDGGSLVGGNQTIFSFSVTADGNGNTDDNGNPLEAAIQQLKFLLSTDVSSATAENVSSIQLCSVDTGSCVNVTTSQALNSAGNTSANLQLTGGGDASFVTTTAADAAGNQFTQDEISIEDGETKEFAIKATISNVTDKFLQVSLQDVDSNGIKWGYDTDGTASTYEVRHGDLLMAEPRPTSYPDFFGGSLD